MDLAACSSFFRLLSDPTRMRLLALLEAEELAVAELSAITRLAQPRVSTHLSKLKELDLVRDRRAGVSAYYRFNDDIEPAQAKLWQAIKESADDALLKDDLKRLPSVLGNRAHAEGWADSMAGDMERHYSPGRTWEALARGFVGLFELGDVLDIASGDGVVAELLAKQARSITCVDSGKRVVEAARKRLAGVKNVEVLEGDMHDLQLPADSFDLVLMMHALPFSNQPAVAIKQATRVLRPGGKLLALTLGKHAHKSAVEPFDHRNLGFSVAELSKLATGAGLKVQHCERITRERRSPHFEVLALLAIK